MTPIQIIQPVLDAMSEFEDACCVGYMREKLRAMASDGRIDGKTAERIGTAWWRSTCPETEQDTESFVLDTLPGLLPN